MQSWRFFLAEKFLVCASVYVKPYIKIESPLGSIHQTLACYKTGMAHPKSLSRLNTQVQTQKPFEMLTLRYKSTKYMHLRLDSRRQTYSEITSYFLPEKLTSKSLTPKSLSLSLYSLSTTSQVQNISRPGNRVSSTHLAPLDLQ